MADVVLTLVDLVAAAPAAFGRPSDATLQLVDLLPGVRVLDAGRDDLDLRLAPVLKGDRGEQGPPGRDADPEDVVALLAVNHAYEIVDPTGAVVAVLFGE